MLKTQEQLREEFYKQFKDTKMRIWDTVVEDFMPIHVADWWLTQRENDRTALVEKIKNMPSRCVVCEKTGTNPFGECACSYETKDFIKKSDILSLLTTEETK